MYSVCDTLAGGFPHSEISGSKLICQLPEAYRRLSRPSSPVIAKAFTTCTCSLSVDHEYLALEDGPPIFRQDFTCPALLVASSVPHGSFHIRGYHPLWPAFPDRSVKFRAITSRLFRFRSPLLSESRLMSFPPATEMFQFAGFASLPYVFR